MLEGRAGMEAGLLLAQLPLLRLQAKRGNGQVVLVLPGFMADDGSTIVLRHYLNAIGYRAKGWGLGVNRRKMLDFVGPLTELVRQIVQQQQEKLRLVGWSRGGILARELARENPDLIDRVITIGSPVRGGIEVASIGRWVRQETGMSAAVLAAMMKQRENTPITVPIRSIYSKSDGVVAWKACIDEVSPDVEHFEIRGSHIGMGTNVEVFKLLPDLLL